MSSGTRLHRNRCQVPRACLPGCQGPRCRRCSGRARQGCNASGLVPEVTGGAHILRHSTTALSVLRFYFLRSLFSLPGKRHSSESARRISHLWLKPSTQAQAYLHEDSILCPLPSNISIVSGSVLVRAMSVGKNGLNISGYVAFSDHVPPVGLVHHGPWAVLTGRGHLHTGERLPAGMSLAANVHRLKRAQRRRDLRSTYVLRNHPIFCGLSLVGCLCKGRETN
ncbi:hypothetical protein F5X99DRAFT_174801 [Biscogniauxia marginata]|nr:hypothetical protein F5X99DRAFT_174801 [Biscogniauxia marginata]